MYENESSSINYYYNSVLFLPVIVANAQVCHISQTSVDGVETL